MIQQWVKLAGGKLEWNGIIQGVQLAENQNWLRCVVNGATHRMRVVWGEHQPDGTTDPKLRMPMVRVFPEEVPLVELQRSTDDFKKLGADSLKWLSMRHALKLVAPKQPGPGDGKAQESEMVREALRALVKTEQGKAHGRAPAADDDKDGEEPTTDAQKMTDGQLEEGLAMAGGDVPRDWQRIDRKSKEALYRKALAKGGVVAGASK